MCFKHLKNKIQNRKAQKEKDSIKFGNDTINLNGKSVNNEKELSDELRTFEEQQRDQKITNLLEQYVTNYKNKSESNVKFKKLIFWICILIISLFSIVILITVILVASGAFEINKESIIALISALVTYLGSTLGILKIITDYVFPIKEDENITNTIGTILSNDLENKKINLNYKINIQKSNDKKDKDDSTSN